MKWTVLAFGQRAGSFYAGVVRASDILPLVEFRHRGYDPDTHSTYGGVQRDTVPGRVREIAEYSASPDASFPTSVVIAVPDGSYRLSALDPDGSMCELEYTLEPGKPLTVIDGQHRLQGLQESGNAALFQLPVVFVLEPTEEQMAFMFATINGKQVPVPKSVIYDLFGVTRDRSPQKTAHEIARELNSDRESPWFERIKMLGRKTSGSEESLSQGALVTRLLPLISGNPAQDLSRIREGLPVESWPNCIFNEYYVLNEDHLIYRVLMNYFTAAKNTWTKEWASSEYLLTKAVGFSGMMKALDALVRAGAQQKDLSCEHFQQVFATAKEAMLSSGKNWKSFESSDKGAAEIAKFLTDALSSVMSGSREPAHSS